MRDAPCGPIAIIVDSLPLRGASIAALVTPWAKSSGCDVVVEYPESICADRHGSDVRFIILSVGGMSLHHSQLTQWTEDIMEASRAFPA
jgi:hypothetical protein